MISIYLSLLILGLLLIGISFFINEQVHSLVISMSAGLLLVWGFVLIPVKVQLLIELLAILSSRFSSQWIAQFLPIARYSKKPCPDGCQE